MEIELWGFIHRDWDRDRYPRCWRRLLPNSRRNEHIPSQTRTFSSDESCGFYLVFTLIGIRIHPHSPPPTTTTTIHDQLPTPNSRGSRILGRLSISGSTTTPPPPPPPLPNVDPPPRQPPPMPTALHLTSDTTYSNKPLPYPPSSLTFMRVHNPNITTVGRTSYHPRPATIRAQRSVPPGIQSRCRRAGDSSHSLFLCSYISFVSFIIHSSQHQRTEPQIPRYPDTQIYIPTALQSLPVSFITCPRLA